MNEQSEFVESPSRIKALCERLDKCLFVREQLLAEARKAILNESRVQKVLALNKGFVFENDALEALAKSATQ